MSHKLHGHRLLNSVNLGTPCLSVNSYTRKFGEVVVILGMTFNCMLCFLATRGIPIGLPIIAGVQLLIIFFGFCLIYNTYIKNFSKFTIVFSLWLVVVLCLNESVGLKIGPEILMLATFFLIGQTTATPKAANRLMWFVALLILAVGIFEYFMQELFEQLFNIFQYYVGKGALDLTQEGDTGTTLAENGMRPEGQGRELLAGFLNLHRVGSIFLEPISAGNFTTICTAWVVARDYFNIRGFLLIFIGLAIGILADNRFAVFSSLGVVLMLITPAWRSRLLVGILPFITVLGLMAYGATGQGEDGNSFAGRLHGSGALLDHWTIMEWLGFASQGRVSMDTGYSYLFGNLGVVATAILWLTVVIRRENNNVSTRFFAAISVYGSLSLAISGSFLSIKTAALLWYLYGALQNDDTPRALQNPDPVRPPQATV